jgi:hypothetical protein
MDIGREAVLRFRQEAVCTPSVPMSVPCAPRSPASGTFEPVVGEEEGGDGCGFSCGSGL